jgi:hypothetical protein
LNLEYLGGQRYFNVDHGGNNIDMELVIPPSPFASSGRSSFFSPILVLLACEPHWQVYPVVEPKKEEIDFKAKYFYIAAEMDNYRKRMEREKDQLLKYGNERAVKIRNSSESKERNQQTRILVIL